MPRTRILRALLALLLATVAIAQDTGQGRLVEVRVEGTATYADIVKTIITARVGTAVDTIDLEAERNRVYSLGTFDSVTVEIEAGPTGAVLVVRVVENPRIGEIEFEGVEALSADGLLEALRTTNLLEAGRVYNTTRAEEAKATVRQAYHDAGFPFDVAVDLEVMPAPDLAETAAAVPVRLIYTVDEAATIDEIEFEGNTVLSDADLEAIFTGIEREGAFAPQLYGQTVQAVSTRYAVLGYRGSGVDNAATQLVDGTLTVRIRELSIASIDTTALGVDPSELELQPGDLFNYDTLLADVKRLARGRSSDIQLQAGVSASGGVRVTFTVGAPETAGPVDEIRFEGNTVIDDATLIESLRLGVGDTFTSAVAQEDFGAIVRAYQDRGYRLLTQPDFSYDDGTYVQRVTELKVRDYELRYDGEPGSTQPSVVTRYLQRPGEVMNDDLLVEGLLEVAQLGVVDVLNYGLEGTDARDEVRVIVVLRKRQTGELRPSAQYATDTGLSASVGYSEHNFLGLAHSASAAVEVLSTDIGVMLGGRISYDIPWLYVDALDLEEVPTSISGSIFSVVANNQPLSAAGQTTVVYPGLTDIPDNRVRVGEYTSRATGLGFTVGRPIAPDTHLTIAANGAYTEYKLEPPSQDCEIDGGKVTNGDTCALPSWAAVQYLPTSGLAAFASARVDYDARDDANFPSRGVAAYGGLGVGFGNDLEDPNTDERVTYVYEQVTGGVRTYVALADLMPDEISDPNHVFAVRLDVGHQFGGFYPSSKRFVVGRTNDVGPQIRGYTREDFNLSRTYVTSSLEYRYDFQLSTVATQTVIGIAFVDVGWASSAPGYPEYATPVYGSAGVGVQVNLGFGGVVLPAVRIDYAFSEKHRAGVFGFRIGPVF
ncbi:MAG: POTRA domain-containing protein [Trueperaceae bacterium]